MLECEKDVDADVIFRNAERCSEKPCQLAWLSAVVRLLQLFWRTKCTRAERSDRVVPRY